MSTDNIDINVRVKNSTTQGLNAARTSMRNWLVGIRTMVAAYAAYRSVSFALKPVVNASEARAQLSAFYRDAQRGADEFSNTLDISVKTGTAVKELQAANKALIALRGTAVSTKRELRAMADVAEATGISTEMAARQYVSVIERIRGGNLRNDSMIRLVQQGMLSSTDASAVASQAQAGNRAQAEATLVIAMEKLSRSWQNTAPNLASELRKLSQTMQAAVVSGGGGVGDLFATYLHNMMGGSGPVDVLANNQIRNTLLTNAAGSLLSTWGTEGAVRGGGFLAGAGADMARRRAVTAAMTAAGANPLNAAVDVLGGQSVNQALAAGVSKGTAGQVSQSFAISNLDDLAAAATIAARQPSLGAQGMAYAANQAAAKAAEKAATTWGTKAAAAFSGGMRYVFAPLNLALTAYQAVRTYRTANALPADAAKRFGVKFDQEETMMDTIMGTPGAAWSSAKSLFGAAPGYDFGRMSAEAAPYGPLRAGAGLVDRSQGKVLSADEVARAQGVADRLRVTLAQIKDDASLAAMSDNIKMVVAGIEDAIERSENFRNAVGVVSKALASWDLPMDIKDGIGNLVAPTTVGEIDALIAGLVKFANAANLSGDAVQEVKKQLDTLNKVKVIVRMQTMIDDTNLTLGAFREQITGVADDITRMKVNLARQQADAAKQDKREDQAAPLLRAEAAMSKLVRRYNQYTAAVQKLRNEQQRAVEVLNAERQALDDAARARGRAERKANDLVNNKHNPVFVPLRPDLMEPNGNALANEKAKKDAARKEARDRARFNRRVKSALDTVAAGRPLSPRQRAVLREARAQHMLGGISSEEFGRRSQTGRDRIDKKMEELNETARKNLPRDQKMARAEEAFMARQEALDNKRADMEAGWAEADAEQAKKDRDDSIKDEGQAIRDEEDKARLGLLLTEREELKKKFSADKAAYEQERAQALSIGDEAGAAALDAKFLERAAEAKKAAADLDKRITALRDIDLAAVKVHLPNMDQTLTNIETLLSSALGAPWQGRGE